MPTLRELEAVCQKPNWRGVGSLLARRFARPVALYLTWLIVRWPISANAVTTVALVVGWSAAICFGMSSAQGPIAGAVLLQLWYLLDHVDGQVARFRRSESVTGVYFDFMMHHLVHPACAFSLGYGMASRTGDLRWTLAGAAFALGVMALALTNDCRYKAFFAVLRNGKSRVWSAECGVGNAECGMRSAECGVPEGTSVEEYSIAARTQHRPAGTPYSVLSTQYSAIANPPASSPTDCPASPNHSGDPYSSLLTPHSLLLTPHSALRPPPFRLAHFVLRLLQKCGEMPNIVLALTALAAVIAVDSAVGFRAIQWYVIAMSVLAPALGTIRLTKQVWCRLPDAEFQEFASDR